MDDRVLTSGSSAVAMGPASSSPSIEACSPRSCSSSRRSIASKRALASVLSAAIWSDSACVLRCTCFST